MIFFLVFRGGPHNSFEKSDFPTSKAVTVLVQAGVNDDENVGLRQFGL
jgi:hypothetical protein